METGSSPQASSKPVSGHSPDSGSPESSAPDSTNGNFWRGVREWITVIIIAFVIAVPIRLFVAEPFVVNGASMDPTFSTGQFLIVDRLTYDFEKPQRGDVIVFRYPDDPSIYYIKRIIGLPGETVIIRDGIVSITSPTSSTTVTLHEPYIAADHASYDNFSMTLTSTQYFVMGDNRAQSSDSRVWGPLPANLIIGRPILRLTPFSEIGILPGRYDEATTETTSSNAAYMQTASTSVSFNL